MSITYQNHKFVVHIDHNNGQLLVVDKYNPLLIHCKSSLDMYMVGNWENPNILFDNDHIVDQ